MTKNILQIRWMLRRGQAVGAKVELPHLGKNASAATGLPQQASQPSNLSRFMQFLRGLYRPGIGTSTEVFIEGKDQTGWYVFRKCLAYIGENHATLRVPFEP